MHGKRKLLSNVGKKRRQKITITSNKRDETMLVNCNFVILAADIYIQLTYTT